MNSKPFLVVSLFLNISLVGVVAVLIKSRSTPTLPEQTVAPHAASASVSRTVEKKSAPTTIVTNALVQKFDWRMVESEDYKKYIANLRSIGCPEDTIRDIIIADVNKLFEDRKRALKKPAEKFKFWETGMQKMFAGVMDEETIKQRQALAAEKRALIKELLGIEITEKPDLMSAFNPFEQMLDFLPSEKQGRLMELMQQFQAKQMKRIGNGATDEVDRKELQKAQKEMDAEIAKLLTPEEFQDYELRLSQTAMMMRMQLDGFNPSEQEFRDIFKLQKTFNDEFSPLGLGTQDKEEREKYQAAQKALDEQIKSTLGEQRYADYQREKDYAYKAIAKVAERQGLPKEAANKVFDMKKAAEDQASKLRNDKSLSPEQQQAALKATRAETETGIGEVLGQKGLESYKKQNSAYWLNAISRD